METEVTRQMWAMLKAVQPTLPTDRSDTGVSPTLSHPVQKVLWYEAVLFANLLSVEMGLNPCYYTDSSKTTIIDDSNYDNNDTIYCNFGANGYRLPSEGEWEYFTRAGTTGPFSIEESNYAVGNCGSTSTSGMYPNLETVATFSANSGSKTTAAGSKNASPWGLKDVHGNVNEWCWDWYSSSYPSGNTSDYTGASLGSIRVLRGGSWSYYAGYCRSAYRNYYTPGSRYSHIGFRLLRTSP